MTDPVDQFFERAREDVPTLSAPPGRFDELQTVARRRRSRNTTMVSAAAAVVIAVVGTGAVLGAQNFNGSNTAAQKPSAPTADPTVAVASTPSAAAASLTGVKAPVPEGFKAWSVTFIGRNSWVLGSYPCAGGACAAVVMSSSYPYPWSTVYQPSLGSGQALGLTNSSATIRMADVNDGWIVDSSQVLSTHDGGVTWTPVSDLSGAHITALEDWGKHTYALGPDGSSIWVSSDHTIDSWHEQSGLGLPNWTPGATDLLTPDSEAVAAVRTEGPNVSVSLSHDNGSTWAPLSLPCSSAANEPPPVFALLDANHAQVVCGNGDMYRMPTDGTAANLQGRTKLVPGKTGSMTGVSVSVNITGTYIAYSGSGIYSVIGGKSQARGARLLKGDFRYVGLTDDLHGIALTASPSSSFRVTFNGGRDWTTQSFR